VNVNPATVWQIVDGLPHWLVERLEGRTALGLLGQCRRRGALARLSPVAPNCQTPPSLATLLSGRSPQEHGISGYDVPCWSAENPTAAIAAFDRPPPAVEFIWDVYLARGQRVRLVQIPFLDPARRTRELVRASYGFNQRIEPPAVLSLATGEARLDLPGLGARLRVSAAGDDHYRIEADSESAPRPLTLAMGTWSPLVLAPGARTLVGIERADGQPVLLLLGVWREPLSAGESLRHPFFGGGLSRLFRGGRLGRRIVDGGGGQAERLLARTLRHLGERYTEELVAAVAAADAALIVGYQPFLDLLLHEIGGLLDPDRRYHRPEMVPLVERLLVEALDAIERALTEATRAAAVRPGTSVLVCSDHGMAPVDTVLYPNQVLRDRGWLTSAPDGGIDGPGSACFFHPAETGLLCFNRDRIGPDLPAFRDQVLDGLDAAFAPLGGRLCATETAPAADAPRSWSTTTYLLAGRGRTLKADLGRGVRGSSQKTCDHSTNDGDPQLDGVVVDIAGGALAPGRLTVQAADLPSLVMRGG
jgi:hypothetical protein